MKKVNLLLLFVFVLLSVNSRVKANTNSFKNFNISSQTSYKNYTSNGAVDYVKKSGGASFENVFYITPSYFSKKGSAFFRSVKKGDSSVCTYDVNLAYGGENHCRSKYYKKKATAGASYKLQAKRGTTSDGGSIKISGRWTP